MIAPGEANPCFNCPLAASVHSHLVCSLLFPLTVRPGLTREVEEHTVSNPGVSASLEAKFGQTNCLRGFISTLSPPEMLRSSRAW